MHAEFVRSKSVRNEKSFPLRCGSNFIWWEMEPYHETASSSICLWPLYSFTKRKRERCWGREWILFVQKDYSEAIKCPFSLQLACSSNRFPRYFESCHFGFYSTSNIDIHHYEAYYFAIVSSVEENIMAKLLLSRIWLHCFWTLKPNVYHRHFHFILQNCVSYSQMTKRNSNKCFIKLNLDNHEHEHPTETSTRNDECVQMSLNAITLCRSVHEIKLKKRKYLNLAYSWTHFINSDGFFGGVADELYNVQWVSYPRNCELCVGLLKIVKRKSTYQRNMR